MAATTWADPKRVDLLRLLAMQSLTSKEISERLPFETTGPAVLKACKRYGVHLLTTRGWPPPAPGRIPAKWNEPETRKTLERLAKDGLSARDIAKAMGVTRNAVLGACWRHGVKRAEGQPPSRPRPALAAIIDQPPRPVPSAAMLRLAQFDAVIAQSIQANYATTLEA